MYSSNIYSLSQVNYGIFSKMVKTFEEKHSRVPKHPNNQNDAECDTDRSFYWARRERIKSVQSLRIIRKSNPRKLDIETNSADQSCGNPTTWKPETFITEQKYYTEKEYWVFTREIGKGFNGDSSFIHFEIRADIGILRQTLSHTWGRPLEIRKSAVRSLEFFITQ